MFGEVNESVSAYGLGGHRHVAEIEQELAGVGAAAGQDPGANPGIIGVDFLPHLIPMTRGILSAGHVRPTRPVTQAELDALYAAAYDDEPFVTVVASPPVDQAHDRQQPGPRPRPPRRADRADHRHRRRGQPRQGRRGPGDPVVQPRPRPARDGRARAAAAGALMTRRPTTRPVPATLPRGRAPRRPAGRVPRRRRRDRHQGLGPTGPGDHRHDRRTGRGGRRLHARMRSPRRRCRRSRAEPRGHVGRPARRVRLGDARWSRRAAVPTRRPGPPATPTRPRSGGSCRRRSGSTRPRVAAPLDRGHRDAAAARSRSRPGSTALGADADRRRCRSGGGRRGAAHDRFGDQGRDDDASTCPVRTARPCRSP